MLTFPPAATLSMYALVARGQPLGIGGYTALVRRPRKPLRVTFLRKANENRPDSSRDACASRASQPSGPLSIGAQQQRLSPWTSRFWSPKATNIRTPSLVTTVCFAGGDGGEIGRAHVLTPLTA